MLAILEGHQKLDIDTLKIGITAQLMTVKMALLSCSMFIGMSFGFLGFGLFLLGIREQMNATAHSGERRLQISHMAPGAFILLCATILIGLCATHQIGFAFSLETKAAPKSRPQDTGIIPEVMEKP